MKQNKSDKQREKKKKRSNMIAQRKGKPMARTNYSFSSVDVNLKCIQSLMYLSIMSWNLHIFKSAVELMLFHYNNRLALRCRVGCNLS